MDAITAKVLEMDLSHLTQQEIEWLHAQRAEAQLEMARAYVASKKGA